jgi:hypothetical protein
VQASTARTPLSAAFNFGLESETSRKRRSPGRGSRATQWRPSGRGSARRVEQRFLPPAALRLAPDQENSSPAMSAFLGPPLLTAKSEVYLDLVIAGKIEEPGSNVENAVPIGREMAA